MNKTSSLRVANLAAAALCLGALSLPCQARLAANTGFMNTGFMNTGFMNTGLLTGVSAHGGLVQRAVSLRVVAVTLPDGMLVSQR